MKTLKLLSFTLALGFSMSSLASEALTRSAHWHHCHISTDATLISRSTVFTSAECKPHAPLSLRRVSHIYPRLGALVVDAWQGSYTRAARTTSVYRIDKFDCHGHLVGSGTKTVASEHTIVFSIDNPNLHDDVDSTFAANAPLTDDEAQAAMRGVNAACLRAQP